MNAVRGGRQRATPVGRSDQGFTLIELLVVIIIVGILAAVAIPVFLSQRDKAAAARTRANMRNVMADLVTARESTQKPLHKITGKTYSIDACYTNVTAIPKVSDPGFSSTGCGQAWEAMSDAIAAAANVSPSTMRTILTDGWGRPMMFDENESENTCNDGKFDNLFSTGGADVFIFNGGKTIRFPVPQSGMC